MVNLIDGGGPIDTPVVPYVPVDSTQTPGLAGYRHITFEKPHDSKALYLPMLRGKLSRGFIVQDKGDPAVKNNKSGRPLGLNFLYNPTSVQVSYQIATNIYPTNASAGGDVPLIGVPGSATVGFDLILDRTYDVWKNRRSRGIMHDVDQFLAMMQYADDQPYIQPVATYVVFGNPLHKYYGFIQSFNIVYTNWTQSMVPYRGAISGITMQVLPTSNTKKTSDITKNTNLALVPALGGGSATDTGNGRAGAAA